MKEIHHANVLLGDRGARERVQAILKESLGFETKQNPDFRVFENESFGIDEARALSIWAIGKPFAGEHKAALVLAASLTLEAQNALLKILEEPPLGTYFFISVAHAGGLLDTFLSRVRVWEIEDFSKTASQSKPISAGSFLASGISDRLGIIRKLEKTKDKADLKNLIYDLERAAGSGAVSYGARKNILKAKILSSARGSSPRVLLEWLACVL